MQYKSEFVLKSNSIAKFYQLITSLSVILLQPNLTKLKVEVLKFEFQHKKEIFEHR